MSSIVHVALGERSYDILIREGLLGQLPELLQPLKLGRRCAILTDTNVSPRYAATVRDALTAAGWSVSVHAVPAGESSKSLHVAGKLYEELVEARLNRRSFVLALGGGVVGDLAGFIAATFLRGVDFVQVPTTLLAMVDSSVGGKVAINLPQGKNLVGAFYQPRAVFIDTSFLAKLSRRDYTSGLAEVVKYAIIGDSRMFAELEKDRAKVIARDPAMLAYIVKRCASIKAGIVSRDEKEKKSLRTVLNYGHTIGHAIEAAWDYSGAYTHGEAVSLGMIAAARIANRLGILRAGEVGKIESLISILGLPVKLRKTKVSRIMGALAHDKKFIHGVNRFVLPVRIGKVTVKEKVPVSIIRREIERLSD